MGRRVDEYMSKKIENKPNFNGRTQNTGDTIQTKKSKTKPILKWVMFFGNCIRLGNSRI
jgi:hypothetical protein